MTEDEKDALIAKLKRQLATRNLVINTLRGQLFNAWNLTNGFEADEEANGDGL